MQAAAIVQIAIQTAASMQIMMQTATSMRIAVQAAAIVQITIQNYSRSEDCDTDGILRADHNAKLQEVCRS